MKSFLPKIKFEKITLPRNGWGYEFHHEEFGILGRICVDHNGLGGCRVSYRMETDDPDVSSDSSPDSTIDDSMMIKKKEIFQPIAEVVVQQLEVIVTGHSYIR